MGPSALPVCLPCPACRGHGMERMSVSLPTPPPLSLSLSLSRLSHPPLPSIAVAVSMMHAGESGELGRAIRLDLKEAAEEASGEKPEYDLYRIWKEHLTPVSQSPSVFLG